MGDFVLSMDAHVIEPKTLWTERLPASMKEPTAVLPLHPGRIQDAVVEIERVAGITRGEPW